MFPEAEGAGSLERGHITYFPVAPGRMEFAIAVRRAILDQDPDVVAVELPVSLERLYMDAVKRLPRISVVVYPEDEEGERGVYVPVEPCDPFTEAIRTAKEIGAEVMFIEPDLGDRPHISDAYPDPYALRRIPLDRYIEAYRVFPQERTDEVSAHASGIAWKLQGSDPSRSLLVVLSLNMLDPVLDAMEAPQDEPARRRVYGSPGLANAHPDCLAEVAIEYPYLQQRYEQFRTTGGDALIDRPRVQLDLLKEAEANYQKNTGEVLAHWQRRMIARYTRNLAMISSDLTASLFDIVVAARNIVDDNYAWEVWDLANRYQAQESASDIETLNLSSEDVWFRTRRMRLRRRTRKPRQRAAPASLKPRKKESRPGEWAKELNGDAICSYPPEDIVIEDYGEYLKQKANSLLSEERLRVEPFLTSLLDGIDLRETIRNWHAGKLFVKNLQKIAGQVGAVVVVFDPGHDSRYPYLRTWLGEHSNESDMAYYATDPFANLVGPGIGRGEYGGFLMTRPARRLENIWTDPSYDSADNKPERLLLAALDYSLERYVVYVAAKPPRSIFRSVASHLGRRIIYVPIGQLASPKLKKLRVVHVLDGQHRRRTAKDYVW
ncbi:MAG: hypothetical protein FJW39_07295 [Acidobacteria bacterium]|nr:hypothetical protein [Acidobacteriota bacterium]